MIIKFINKFGLKIGQYVEWFETEQLRNERALELEDRMEYLIGD